MGLSWLFPTCVALVFVLGSASKVVDDDNALEVIFLNVTDAERDESQAASCADGSPALYYYDETKTPGNDSVVIWFGDSPILCSGADCDDQCDGMGPVPGGYCEGQPAKELFPETFDEDGLRCYLGRVSCSSYSIARNFASLRGLALLYEEDAFFGSYRRIFVPSCTLDFMLGNGDNSGRGKAYFRGARVMEELFESLFLTANLANAPNVVLGGTRGGGISVLNNLKRIKGWLEEKRQIPEQRLFAIADSAWYPQFDAFAVNDPSAAARAVYDSELRAKTKDWIDTGVLDPGCIAKWGPDKAYKCLYASEVTRQLQDENVFVIQSQYDMVHLSEVGQVSDDKTDQFIDEVAYAAGAINYVETFGDAVRASVEQVAMEADNHYYFFPSCAQHGYIASTELPFFGVVKGDASRAFELDVGRAGSITVKRSSQEWETVSTGEGETVRALLVQWIQGGGVISRNATDPVDLRYNNIFDDMCTTFLCNDECPSVVSPWQVPTVWPECVRFMMYANGVMILFGFYATFLYSLTNIQRFRGMCNQYWEEYDMRTKQGDKRRNKLSVRFDRSGKMVSNAAGAGPTMNLTKVEKVQQELLEEVSKMEYRKIHLMVKNLTYITPPKKGKEKTILHNVDLCFNPGEVHAMMGPSGSGKSTLLDILALTRDSGSLGGDHFINGVSSTNSNGAFLKEWLRHNLSYVRQMDVLFPQLTVREYLTHAAWLLLPEFMDERAKLRRVLHVIKLLELENCIDTICGDGGVKVQGGISGGQRRRVSIAAQLLRMPSALLLDEPTSGLDATNALVLVKSLHLLAERAGMNVVLTIHQPRKEIYQYLDRLTILNAGKVVFSGPPSSAAQHFRVPPGGMSNIGNEILDILSRSSAADVDAFERDYINGPLGAATREKMEAEVTQLDPAMAKTLRNVLMENALAEGRWSWAESSSASTIMWVLMSRTMKRGGFDLHVTCSLSLLGGIMVGLLFLNVQTAVLRTGLCYLLVATLTFLQGTFLGDRYLAEKEMYNHERDAGTVTSWMAFLSSQFVRNAVSSTLEALCFGVPVYFMAGMNPDIERLLIFFLFMCLISMTCIAQNHFIEVDRDDTRKAALVQVAFLGLGALFNGFIIQLDDIPVYLSWLPYLMLNYWGFVGVLVNDVSGVTFSCNSLNTLECTTQTGDVVIRSLSYDNVDVPICIFALTALVVLYHVLGIIVFYVRYVRKQGQSMKRLKDAPSNSAAASPASAFTLQPSPSMYSQHSNTGKTMDGMISAASPSSRSKADLSDVSSHINLDSNLNVVKSGGEDDYSVAERDVGIFGKFFVSRQTLAVVFLVDFFSTGYVCGFGGGPAWDALLIGYGLLFCLIFLAQYIYQLVYLIPHTPGGVSDCIWAGGYDGLGAICTVSDVAISFIFVITGLNLSDFVIVFAMQMFIKVFRFMRVATFWGKVTGYHRIRAEGFSRSKAEAQTADASAVNLNSSFKDPPPGRQAPANFTQRLSARFSKKKPTNKAGGAPPPRPPRPAIGLSAAFGRPSVNKRRPPPVPRRNVDLGPMWQSYHRTSVNRPQNRTPAPTSPLMNNMEGGNKKQQKDLLKVLQTRQKQHKVQAKQQGTAPRPKMGKSPSQSSRSRMGNGSFASVSSSQQQRRANQPRSPAPNSPRSPAPRPPRSPHMQFDEELDFDDI